MGMVTFTFGVLLSLILNMHKLNNLRHQLQLMLTFADIIPARGFLVMRSFLQASLFSVSF